MTNKRGRHSQKNKVENSHVSAGERVHIGDQIVNNYSGSNPRNGGKSGLKVTLISLTLLSVTIFSLSFSNNEFVFLQVLFGEKSEQIINKPASIPPNEEEGGNEEDQPKEEDPSGNDEPLDEPPTVKPKLSIADYANISLSIKTAFWGSRSAQLPAFQKAVEEQFVRQDISVSNRYFKPAFENKFGRDLERLDVGSLQDIGLSKHLNCICEIRESIKYEPNEIEGMHMVTARGRVSVLLLNLTEGRLRQYTFTENGAGISEPSALESLEEHLLKSPKLAEISVQKCQ
ncbi:hypothetical protein [Phaeodactylibacter sp.]|jgi:hypothetical protein|uniref:hypothetical protein n=1 Tax=Phaeodactylibacter sp. TaxID=1940289 RepID=UPI0025DAC1BC|nr:hypothetical protein [Phaeodactylibacter sp.]MCI4650019.1 hypothetical protein [Phaeodactylibacter sp.]MCI5093366.1 hypothetical protein [Phaeodactylibacter sp.]